MSDFTALWPVTLDKLLSFTLLSSTDLWNGEPLHLASKAVKADGMGYLEKHFLLAEATLRLSGIQQGYIEANISCLDSRENSNNALQIFS